MSNHINEHPWPTADLIYIDRAVIVGQGAFEPGVYLLNYDPYSGSRDYCRAGPQLLQDPDPGDKILEGIDEIISWYEVDTETLYALFENAPDTFEGGDPA
nr:MAG TPA: hypothetical protein [Caudoviricetes sp.]